MQFQNDQGVLLIGQVTTLTGEQTLYKNIQLSSYRYVVMIYVALNVYGKN